MPLWRRECTHWEGSMSPRVSGERCEVHMCYTQTEERVQGLGGDEWTEEQTW